MKRAVFLDRDGVINAPVVIDGKPYPPKSLIEFRLLPGVVEGCHRLKESGYLLILATNQPDVGRGSVSQESVEEIHRYISALLFLDSIKVCYDAGKSLPPCKMRKPLPGMLLEAAQEFDIDLGRSYMIGDRWRDMDCGFAAGCKTLFIDYDYDEKLTAIPDYRVFSFLEAVDIILRIN